MYLRKTTEKETSSSTHCRSTSTCGYVDGASVTPINNTAIGTVDTIYDEHVQTIAVLGECLCETEMPKLIPRIFSAQYVQVAEFLHL